MLRFCNDLLSSFPAIARWKSVHPTPKFNFSNKIPEIDRIHRLMLRKELVLSSQWFCCMKECMHFLFYIFLILPLSQKLQHFLWISYFNALGLKNDLEMILDTLVFIKNFQRSPIHLKNSECYPKIYISLLNTPSVPKF